MIPWTAEALAQYIGEVRTRFRAGRHPALVLTERGGRISLRQVDDRNAAGLPAEFSVHCLRHSCISHLIEDGADPLVRAAAGRSFVGLDDGRLPG